MKDDSKINNFLKIALCIIKKYLHIVMRMHV